MTVMSGVDVHKRQCRVVLEELHARDLPGDDFAEHAIWIGLHLALPVE
jgi:hypothetical protein